MRTLLLAGISSVLLGSPAMSTTYLVDGYAGGAPEQTISQDTPDSISGGANGATFTANSTNVGGGSVSAFASEGLSDVTDYNNSAGSHYYGLAGGATATVNYTIRVSGPVTGALIPVHINAIASAGSLDVPDPVGSYYAPIIASTGAQVSVQYAEGDVPVGAPEFLASIYADTHYDYRYFVDPAPGYAAPVLLGNTSTFNDEVLIEANFDVSVLVYASAGADFESTYASYTETAEGGASADPTFTIDEPGYSAYSIEGVPAGPAAAPVPEPATWAMMLLGFAGLGYAGYRRAREPRAA
jgi:PEP-CTERM motif